MSVTVRYFCCGCVLTSVTWSLLLLLYFHLGSSHSRASQPIGGILERRGAVRRAAPANQDTELSPEMGMIYNEQDQEVRDSGYHRHAFNVLISNRLGSHRHIPDTRGPQCLSQVFPPSLPSASVIICFFNEALSALLRTVHSVLDRTPPSLLHEIILVDDCSQLDDLKQDLESYVSSELKDKVKLVRNEKREGLIRGRMIGARHATGQVLVFLDSHCEVNVLWLEPLLALVGGDRRKVVCPVIDIISADTLTYSPSPLVRGGFNWGLHFRWDPVPPSEQHGDTTPIRSPTMAGGLFAMDRNYFFELGQYDPGMDIWGGENLELSFRIWMCGGQLLIAPCSRVGHIFRKRRPYGSPGGTDTMAHNSLRLAHVWMDQYKERYLSLRPDLIGRSFGDVSERVELRRRLQCRSFHWFLVHVYPEMSSSPSSSHKDPPPRVLQRQVHKPRVLHRGRLQNVASGLCLVAQTRVSQKGGSVVLRSCDPRDPEQDWTLDAEGQLVLAGLLCLDVSEVRTSDLRLMKCHGSGGSQQWTLGKSSRLYQVSVGQCLSMSAPLGPKGYVSMAICDQSEAQQWRLEA